MPDRFRNATLSATQRRQQEAELDVDVDPADLMEAFEKCKKGQDGAVEAKVLCNELTVEAGAPVFARKIEGMKKARFTRSEFERLVAAYEVKLQMAEREGKQPAQKKLTVASAGAEAKGGGGGARDEKESGRREEASKEKDAGASEAKGGGGDDVDMSVSLTNSLGASTALNADGSKNRLVARLQAQQSQRLKRTGMLSATKRDEQAKEGAKEIPKDATRDKSRGRPARADSGDDDALAPPNSMAPPTAQTQGGGVGAALKTVFGGIFTRSKTPGSLNSSPAPTPEKSRAQAPAAQPSPNRPAEAGESPARDSASATRRRLSLRKLSRGLSWGQAPLASPNPVASSNKTKQPDGAQLDESSDPFSAASKHQQQAHLQQADLTLTDTLTDSVGPDTSGPLSDGTKGLVSLPTPSQQPPGAPAVSFSTSTSAREKEQSGKRTGLWNRLTSPQKAAAAFQSTQQDKMQPKRAATLWDRRTGGTQQLDASAAAFNLSESDEDEPPTSARSQAHQPPTPHMPTPINTDDKGPVLDLKSPMDPALSTVVAGMNHVAGEERPQLTQLLEAAQRRTITSLGNQRRNKVLMEGRVEQWSRSLGMSTWVKLHMVLYAGSKEIRIYQDCVQASWGTVPIHEKGGIALRLLDKIECPTDPKWQGRRFDLVCKSLSTDAKYPGLSIKDGEEDRVTRTARYAFRAPSAQNRLLWVTLIQAILDIPAPPKPARPFSKTTTNSTLRRTSNPTNALQTTSARALKSE